MRVLLVEDDLLMSEVLAEAFESSPIELFHVQSRDGAIDALGGEGPFDLAICDLRIPPTDAARDADLAHGLAVCDHIRDTAPGTPIIVFSAFGTLEVLGKRLARAPNLDIVGRDEWPLLDHADKDRLDEFTDQVLGLAHEIETLHREIEITWGGAAADLTRLEQRAILIYARRRAGVIVRARVLAGGRSSARTLRLDVEGDAAQLASRVLAKINSLEVLDDEKKRYERFVAPLLPAGRYASLIEEVRAGAGDRGAAIFSLAGGDFNSTLFECLAGGGTDAAKVVELLRASTAPWADAKEPETTNVGEVRADMIPDVAFWAVRPRLGSAPVEEVETQDVYVFRSPAHGDLHGGNVLVDDQNNPLLIDFGRVGPAVASLDPVTLELSAILHPDAGLDSGGWPTVLQAERWFSLRDYVTGCPVADFVESCRAWAHDVARGDREVLTAAYSYAARQLQYATVNQDLARAYVRGTLNALKRTTVR